MEFTAESIKKYIDILPDHYMAITCEGADDLQMVTYSSGTPEIFGMTEEEFTRYLGRDAVKLILPQDRQQVITAILNGFKDRKSYECVYRDIHKTMGFVWVHVKSRVSGTLDGKPLCLASINTVEVENRPYEAVLNNSPYGICIIDSESCEILYANEEYAHMAGRPLKECIGKTASEITGKRLDLDRRDFLYKTYVYRVPEDGRIIDIKAMKSRWGLHETLIIFLADVTAERKQTLEAALSAKEHLDAIMHMNSNAMSTFRINLSKDILSDGVSNYPNLMQLQEKKSMNGYVEDALQFFPFEKEREIFASRFSCENLLKEYRAGRTQVSMTHHYMLTDREHRVLKTIVNMIQNRETDDVEGIVYTLDATRETYYRKINEIFFDNSHIGIVVINIKKKTFIMPQASSILDFPISYEEQDYEKGVHYIADHYVPEEDRKKYLNCAALSNIVKYLERGERYTYGATWVRDGKRLNIRISNYFLDELHEQIIGIAEDITEVTAWEREQVERYRNALNQVEKANRAKSDFLSSMSHDIRTPLNAILNLASLLHEELQDPEKLEGDIQKIEVAGEFLLQLINDVLDVSAIESGKLKLNPRVYTYSTFLNYIKGIIVPLCEDKDIKFVLDEGPTALDIYMDRVRFHQVFFNLLSNAVKYTPPGGTVQFKTTNNVVHDGILTCDFVVRDTGCGMSREFLEKAFDPFEREDSQNAYVGTGLGLTICKRIVEMMGGTITVESEIGKGTTVTVHMDLQIATEEQKKESQVEMDTSYHRNVILREVDRARILVVEDNEINREILSRLLEKKGVVVDCAENGKVAVQKIREHEGSYYQMILMDIRMPVMDGLTATALIRQDKDERKSHIPIIAITANAFEEDAKECINAGMNAYLSKPVSSNALYAMMATYIQTE